MYSYILILCGILPQIIIGGFADQEIRKSSDLLLRQKRVISRIPGEDVVVPITSAPYVVHIKDVNRISCVGSILSHHVVITVISCVSNYIGQYKVVSKTTRSDHGVSHDITNILRQFGGHQGRSMDGISLLTVVPPFVYGNYVRNIELHSGHLLPGTIGTIYGWGYNSRTNNRGTEFPRHLRSIEVPIIAHRDCVDRYRQHNIIISEKDVCTYHPERNSGHNDVGAPLVVDGELAGVHLWTGPIMMQNNPLYPEVFAMLQHYEYLNWIRSAMNAIEAHYNH